MNDMDLQTYALEHAIEDIFATKVDGMLVFANKQFRIHHAIDDMQDVAALNIKDLSPVPNTRQHWEYIVGEVEKGGGRAHFFLSEPIPDSPDVLAYEGEAYSDFDADGEKIYWAFGHDVSELVDKKQEIQRYNLILDKVMENLPAGIVVKDVNNGFKYLYRNKESFNRDIPIQYAVGKDDFDFHPLEIAKMKRKQDEKLAETGEELHWIAEEKDRSGKPIFLDKRKMRIVSEGSAPVLLSIEWNITDMEKMKRNLLKAKERAEESDKLKSAFLANISHEIRTPLNAIVGFSQLIAECDDAEERRTYYGVVEESSGHLLKLVNEILDLSKIEAGMSVFDVVSMKMDKICRKVYGMLYLRCPEGVRLIYEPSDTEVKVYGDKGRVLQVFSNLIGNAFKFTKQGSVRYGYKKVGNMVEAYVSDTGMGIEESKLPYVFDRFVKANENVQGTGLGLSICKGIVEKLGGQVSVSSIVGEGSTFSFTLPYSEEPEVSDSEEIL